MPLCGQIGDGSSAAYPGGKPSDQKFVVTPSMVIPDADWEAAFSSPNTPSQPAKVHPPIPPPPPRIGATAAYLHCCARLLYCCLPLADSNWEYGAVEPVQGLVAPNELYLYQCKACL